MKTMTFSGRTMREAIAQAKARFGGDVDILDSDAVGDEVQVTVVVPMARSARRRRALEQVSASINALAASGRTAANGTDSRTASVESLRRLRRIRAVRHRRRKWSRRPGRLWKRRMSPL